MENISEHEVIERDYLIIREVQIEDAERLVDIYSHYVLNTAVSFEYEVPTVEEFRQGLKR